MEAKEEEEEETKDVFAPDLSCLATQPAPGVENKTKKKKKEIGKQQAEKARDD